MAPAPIHRHWALPAVLAGLVGLVLGCLLGGCLIGAAAHMHGGYDRDRGDYRHHNRDRYDDDRRGPGYPGQPGYPGGPGYPGYPGEPGWRMPPNPQAPQVPPAPQQPAPQQPAPQQPTPTPSAR